MKLSIILPALVLMACAQTTAHLKRETPTAGRVKVVGKDALKPQGMAKAESLMKEKCGGSYEKIEWGEESSGVTVTEGAGFAEWKTSEIPAMYVEFKCNPATSPK